MVCVALQDMDGYLGVRLLETSHGFSSHTIAKRLELRVWRCLPTSAGPSRVYSLPVSRTLISKIKLVPKFCLVKNYQPLKWSEGHPNSSCLLAFPFNLSLSNTVCFRLA